MTVRTKAQLLALYADNVAGDISAEDLRDFVDSAALIIIGAASPVGAVTAPEGVLFWDAVGDQLYVNNDSGTGWTLIAGGGGSLIVQELDGAPIDTAVTIIRVPNGGLTDNGAGDVTLGYEIAGAVAAHVVAGDPHSVYALDTDLTTHAGAADPHAVYQKESEKAAVNGYASLDATTKVPTAQLGSGAASGATFLRGDRSWAGVPGGATTLDHAAIWAMR